MATQAFYNWANAGRPWEVARPIAELVAYARAHGIAILGTIGNDDHLTAGFPEDHTPFSFTAWPVELPGWFVCACDLANTQGLGEALLRDAKSGRAPWIKYLNFGYRHYNIQNGWQPTSSGDEHLHVSARSDWCTRSIGSYDPLGSGGGEGGDMLPDELVQQNYDGYPGVPDRNTISSASALASAERRAYIAALESRAANTKLDRVEGLVKASAAADAANAKLFLAAIQAISSDGGPDTAPVIAVLREQQEENRAEFAKVHEENARLASALAASEAREAALERRLAEAAQAEADRLAGN